MQLMKKNQVILTILVGLFAIFKLQAEDQASVSSLKDTVKGVSRWFDDHPFTAGNEAGSCLYKGFFAMDPAKCAGKDGADLVTCCEALTKNDLNKSELLRML